MAKTLLSVGFQVMVRVNVNPNNIHIYYTVISSEKQTTVNVTVS